MPGSPLRTLSQCMLDGQRVWHVGKLAKRQGMVTTWTSAGWFVQMLQQRASRKSRHVPCLFSYERTCRYWLDMPCLHIKLLGCLTGAGCFHETPTMLLVWEHHALPTARALTCPNWVAGLWLIALFALLSQGLGFACNVVRMGLQDGFTNEMLKKTHDVGTRVINETKLSVHENVLEYEEDLMFFRYAVLLGNV